MLTKSKDTAKFGLSELSVDKINSTLIAENPDLEQSIRAFHKQKAEQNTESIEPILGSAWQGQVDKLERIGFLERTGATWKIPMLYRDGLEITQGAAFHKKAAEDGNDDDD